MSVEYFYCGACDMEIGDPFADRADGMVYGQCECGRELQKPDLTEVADVGQERGQ